MTDHLLDLYFTRRRAYFRLSVGATFAKVSRPYCLGISLHPRQHKRPWR